MIAICEPQCKGISHEKVNSGFIYGLRLAYPQEKIVFLADATHFQAIQNILENDKVLVDNYECRPIRFNADSAFSIAGTIKYYLLFTKKIEFDKNGLMTETELILTSQTSWSLSM